MSVWQTRYELQAGETVPISAPQDTLTFLSKAKNRRIDLATRATGASSSGLAAGPNRAGDQILLAASLRVDPGEYTVTLSATSAAGEQRQTSLSVVVKPRTTVPSNSTRPPVVLLNGWQTGITGTCNIAASSSETFGNLAQYLIQDGVPVVYLFDNCLEDSGQSIETLGNDLGDFLQQIKYDNGTQVPQIDLVGFSMGGLIARSYLAGLQTDQTLTPPTTTLVRNLVLLATPNFGSYLAGTSSSLFAPGSQGAEMVPGSAFLWNLATWNQRNDDLNGINAIAIIGNAGEDTATSLLNASDGVVSLPSASGGFVVPQGAVSTRIVPYCHVDPAVFTNTSLGTYACNAVGIANVNNTSHQTGTIIRSFLAGTTAWQSIGSAPASNTYLAKNGDMFFAVVNASGAYLSDLTAVTFGSGVALASGGDAGTIYFVDFVFGTGVLAATSTSLGSINCGSFPEPLGYGTAVRCKLGTAIFSVGPLNGKAGRAVNAGSAVTITGSGFGTQCTGCKLIATAAGSTTGQTLTTTAWSNTSITANLPASMTGLIAIQVNAVAGTDTIFVMTTPTSTVAVSPTALQFAYTAGGAAPAAQAIQITNSASGTLAWSATGSDSWIAVSPASGTAPSTLSVTVSPDGLNAGTYTGSVQIAAAGASNSPTSIPVTFTVTASPPVLGVAPQALTFQYANGGAAPAAQNVTISNTGGGSLAWTATASDYWLTVSAASGSAPATLGIGINPVNLAAGTYTGSVQIAGAGATGSPVAIAVKLVVTGNPPAGTISGVGNAASFQPAFASATWVSVYGANLSQSTYTWQTSDFVNGQLPTSLQGVSVMIDGKPAYVEFISPTQINVLAPDDATTGNVQVQVTTAQQNSNSLSAQKTQFAPAFFAYDGGAYVAAEHADYSLVGPTNILPGVTTAPAKPGETILLYATGFGPTSPPLPTGQLVTDPGPLLNPVEVTIGGVAANVSFSGLVGPGLYQFNVTVPNVPNGDAALAATIGGVNTQTGVSVSVHQ
jgi:uncharacterized protein (TIGR03437 family)